MSAFFDSWPGGVSDARLEQALAATAEGDGAAVLALCEQIIQDQPGAGAAYFLMASEYAAQGEIERSEAAFWQAVLWMPDFPVARYQLGLLQYSSGRTAEALVTWQPLLDLGEDNPLTHWVRGFGFLAQSQLEVARLQFETGLACPVEHPPMAQDIQRILQALDGDISRQSDMIQPVADVSSERDEQAVEMSHVLLSRYRPEGPAH